MAWATSDRRHRLPRDSGVVVVPDGAWSGHGADRRTRLGHACLGRGCPVGCHLSPLSYVADWGAHLEQVTMIGF